MTYGSVCSGIEAATVAWEPLGWKAAFYSEIDKFPSRVLAHHYPCVPNAGDFTTIQNGDYAAINLLVGGTPCQAFSVAGLRAGLDDPRGNLTIEYARLAGQLRPRWLVWENVPGVLSIDGGRTFGTFLGMLGELGYGVAYRVLDAQHFGVPQRRRRVFVVGHLGDWRRAAAVLFERHSLSGHPAPRREKGQTAPGIACRSVAGSLTSNYGKQPDNSDSALGPNLIASTGSISHCLNGGGMGRQDFETETLLAVGGFPDTVGALQTHHTPNGHGCAGVNSQQVAAGHVIPVPIALQAGCVRENPDSGPDGIGVREDGIAYTLEARAEVQAVAFRTNAAGQVDCQGDKAAAVTTMTDPCSQFIATVAIQNALRGKSQNGLGITDDDTMYTLDQGSQHAVAFESRFVRNGRGAPSDIVPPLKAQSGQTGKGDAAPLVAMAFQSSQSGVRMVEQHATLDSNNGSRRHNGVVAGMAVRRLTPRECERLQGFPDDYTKLSGKTADGPRYKALGNSMAVPVMRWIGERIKAVDAIPGDYLIAPPVKPDQTLEELLTEEDLDALALPPELEAPGQ